MATNKEIVKEMLEKYPQYVLDNKNKFVEPVLCVFIIELYYHTNIENYIKAKQILYKYKPITAKNKSYWWSTTNWGYKRRENFLKELYKIIE